MALTRKLYRHENNVACQLNAGISAGTLTIPLKAGHGAQLPSTVNGSATSAGTTTVLNSTGIGASGVAVGDIIENVTDGSYGVITVVSTNSVTTTRLKGGTDNTWDNSDKWHVGRFIVTLINYDVDGETILKREMVLIDSRSTDTLTVNASGRGFDGSTAQSFSTDDYVYLFWTAASVDGLQQGLGQVIQDIDRLVSQSGSEVYAADSVGTDAYAISVSPAPTAYTTGMVFNFSAGTANTGAATLNVNSLGAKTIKKFHDQDLETGDIEVGQILTVIYDGTNFQMQSQLAALYATKANVQDGSIVYAADAGGTDAYAITLAPAPTAYTTGMVVHFKANTANTGAATLNVNALGAKTIVKLHDQTLATGDIESGQIVSVVYDGTNFQMQSQIGQVTPVPASGTLSLSATGTQSVSLGFLPRFVRIFAKAKNTSAQYSAGASDGTNNNCVWVDTTNNSSSSASHAYRVGDNIGTRDHSGTVGNFSASGFDVVNTKTSTAADVILLWEAYP